MEEKNLSFLDEIKDYVDRHLNRPITEEPGREVGEDEEVIGTMTKEMMILFKFMNEVLDEYNGALLELQGEERKIEKADIRDRFEFYKKDRHLNKLAGRALFLKKKKEAVERLFWASVRWEFLDEANDPNKLVAVRMGWKIVLLDKKQKVKARVAVDE